LIFFLAASARLFFRLGRSADLFLGEAFRLQLFFLLALFFFLLGGLQGLQARRAFRVGGSSSESCAAARSAADATVGSSDSASTITSVMRPPSPGAKVRLRFTSTVTALERPWLKLCRADPAG
jgi:hypothetical protein